MLKILLCEEYSLSILDHFANPCILCDCFVEYADRDLTIFASPYLIAKNPYESTEDQCLSACLNDKVFILCFNF